MELISELLKHEFKMKKHNIIKSLFSAAILLAAMTACQDNIVLVDELRENNITNKVSTAAPSIKGIYAYNDFYNNDSTPTALSQVELSSEIVVAGENLQGLSTIIFNNDTLSLNEIYTQWDRIVMRVPSTLPENIDNKINFTNSFGTTSVELGLLLPEAEFIRVENEFQLPGRSTLIHGNFFSLYGFDKGKSAVVLEDANGYSQELTVTEATETTLAVNIPSDAPDNACFKFVLYGKADAQRLHYRPTNTLLFGGLNPVNTLNVLPAGFSYTDGSGAGDPENLIPYAVGSGTEMPKFYRQSGSVKKWATMVQIKEDIAFEIADGKTASDYYLAFEINTAVGKPIPIGETYMYAISGAKTTGMWEDFGQVVIDTNGEWQTQRIDFVNAKFKLGSFVDVFIIKSAKVEMPNVDHSFANFRIELKQP